MAINGVRDKRAPGGVGSAMIRARKLLYSKGYISFTNGKIKEALYVATLPDWFIEQQKDKIKQVGRKHD